MNRVLAWVPAVTAAAYGFAILLEAWAVVVAILVTVAVGFASYSAYLYLKVYTEIRAFNPDSIDWGSA